MEAPSAHRRRPLRLGGIYATVGTVAGGYTAFYPCIGSLCARLIIEFTMLEFSLTGLHLAAASSH
jgi:hypothetical protein